MRDIGLRSGVVKIAPVLRRHRLDTREAGTEDASSTYACAPLKPHLS
jgi:hypothetical protein